MKLPAAPEAAPVPAKPDETPFEAVASICSVLVVGLYILTFLAQNFVILGSMEKTLLVGDHLVVDRISLAPPRNGCLWSTIASPGTATSWSSSSPSPSRSHADGNPQYFFLVKRLIGIPGDHIHLRDGIVYINGVAQPGPKTAPTIRERASINSISTNFPPFRRPRLRARGDASWADDAPNHIVDGDLVVPPACTS